MIISSTFDQIIIQSISNQIIISSIFDPIIISSIFNQTIISSIINRISNFFRSRNFKLLSFGEEAEEDEEETVVLNKQFVGKSKSAHDNLADPKLSSEVEPLETTKREESSESDEAAKEQSR